MSQTNKQPRGPVPVRLWNDYFDWPPEGGLRHIIFHADSNGFEPAIKRVGRTVLIDPEKFWQIVDDQAAK